jgi:hypothetical protein
MGRMSSSERPLKGEGGYSMKFRLGDKVTFNNELIRKSSSMVNSALGFREAKQLNGVGELPETFTRYSYFQNKEAQVGYICGVRNIKFKGFSKYSSYDEGYIFATIESKQVYLVATNMNGFHRVLPEDVTLISIGEICK